MIFGFISLVLFGWLLFPRVTGWIIFLIAISLVSALGSSISFEKPTYLLQDQQQQELVHGSWDLDKRCGSSSLE